MYFPDSLVRRGEDAWSTCVQSVLQFLFLKGHSHEIFYLCFFHLTFSSPGPFVLRHQSYSTLYSTRYSNSNVTPLSQNISFWSPLYFRAFAWQSVGSIVHPSLNLVWYSFTAKNYRACKSMWNWFTSVFIDTAVSLTSTSFDSVVSMTPQSFYLTIATRSKITSFGAVGKNL